MTANKMHWETIYETKTPDQVSWTQNYPQTSLEAILETTPNRTAPIIDLGGGDSQLVDHLLELGYTDITVVDIAAKALERAKFRLGEKANRVHWIEADIAAFTPERHYSCWHDRAAFHFLTTPEAIAHYKASVLKAAPEYCIIGTFAPDGPLKCSGLEIQQYDEDRMETVFQPEYLRTKSLRIAHTTPFETIQNFIFCTFKIKR
jgi:SAM-dependent methyltransferase